MVGKRRTELTPKQALFVKHYIACGVQRHAAILAGYSEGNADKTARALLNNPLVQAILENHKNEVIAEGKHTYERAMAEAKEAMDFAQRTDNANAYIRAVEHRAKLSGLLIERHDIRASGSFQLIISGVFDQILDAKPVEPKRIEKER